MSSESWRARIHEPVVIIEGDDEQFRGQTCISDRGRPFTFGRHAWSRAEWHVRWMVDIPWHVREKAMMYCRQVTESILIDNNRPKPPKFSWKGIPGKL
jgi:hypothetical protein